MLVTRALAFQECKQFFAPRPKDAFVAAHPEVAGIVRENAVNHIIKESVFVPTLVKRPSLKRFKPPPLVPIHSSPSTPS
ncbi:MAG: hypothetical protein WKF30_06760 [Pyrinomonadaceae bacterium]